MKINWCWRICGLHQSLKANASLSLTCEQAAAILVETQRVKISRPGARLRKMINMFSARLNIQIAWLERHQSRRVLLSNLGISSGIMILLEIQVNLVKPVIIFELIKVLTNWF